MMRRTFVVLYLCGTALRYGQYPVAPLTLETIFSTKPAVRTSLLAPAPYRTCTPGPDSWLQTDLGVLSYCRNNGDAAAVYPRDVDGARNGAREPGQKWTDALSRAPGLRHDHV